MNNNKAKSIIIMLIIITFILFYYQYNKNLMLKKEIGNRLILDYHSMRYTSMSLYEYLEKEEYDKQQLLLYCGKLYKDKQLLRRIIKDDNKVVFLYQQTIESLLDLANNLENVNSVKTKEKIVEQVKQIMNYHFFVIENCDDNESNPLIWYRLYNDGILKKDKY